MRPCTLLDSFETFVELPNAVKGLREIIVQLAVRGALSERLVGESTVAQLKVVANFRDSSRSRGDALGNEAPPFRVPSAWAWTAIGNTMKMINGRAFKTDEWSTEGVPIIRIQNLNNPNAPFNRTQVQVDERVHVNDGEFLISWSGTPGTSFGAFIWNRGHAFLNQHIFRCELAEGIFTKEFLRLAINARLDEMISHAQGGVGLRHITKGKLESILLPMPPLAEQKRIVAKVDELMALCDRLETQQQEREHAHAVLTRASLARFADDPTPDNLAYLFHGSFDTDPADLRRSILTMAVQGRLVVADHTDEPPVETFPQLASSAVDNDGYPGHWLCIPLGAAGDWCGGGTPSKSKPEYWGGEIPWVTPKDMKVWRIAYAQDHVTEQGVDSCSTRLIPKGSLLMVVRGMILSRAFPVALTECEVTVNQDMKALQPADARLSEYLLRFLRAVEPHALALIERSTHGTCKFETEKLHSIVLPIPPLAEQRRIVAKVDELLALVDRLEADRAAARTTGEKLMDAVVAGLGVGA